MAIGTDRRRAGVPIDMAVYTWRCDMSPCERKSSGIMIEAAGGIPCRMTLIASLTVVNISSNTIMFFVCRSLIMIMAVGTAE